MASILLVGDHPIVRLGVRQALASETDLAIAHETDLMEAALDIAASARADLAIVDLAVGGANGLEIIRRLRLANPALPVLVFSVYEEAVFAELAFRAGARGYITKDESPQRLVQAIRELLAGRLYPDPRTI